MVNSTFRRIVLSAVAFLTVGAAAPLNAAGDDWVALHSTVLGKGKCTIAADTSIITCVLEDFSGDPKNESETFRISIYGRNTAQGSFDILGGDIIDMWTGWNDEVPGFPNQPRFTVNTWHCKIDGSGNPTKIVDKMEFYFEPNGRLGLGGYNLDVTGDVFAKVRFQKNIRHWLNRYLVQH